MKHWIETKREYQKEENGIFKTITEELVDPSASTWNGRMDNSIKIIGALSIFIPLLLLFLQYSQSITQKKKEDLSQLCINVAIDVETVKNDELTDKEFLMAYNNLQYKYPAQLALVDNNPLTTSYALVSSDCRNEKTFKKIIDDVTTIKVAFDKSVVGVKINFPENRKDIKGYSVSIDGISKAGQIKEIDSWLSAYYQYRSVYNGPHFDDLDDHLVQQYPKDSVFSSAAEKAYRAVASVDVMYDLMQSLKDYIKKGNTYIFKQYYLNSAVNDRNSPETAFSNSITKMEVLESRVSEHLSQDRQRFQDLVLVNLKK